MYVVKSFLFLMSGIILYKRIVISTQLLRCVFTHPLVGFFHVFQHYINLTCIYFICVLLNLTNISLATFLSLLSSTKKKVTMIDVIIETKTTLQNLKEDSCIICFINRGGHGEHNKNNAQGTRTLLAYDL